MSTNSIAVQLEQFLNAGGSLKERELSELIHLLTRASDILSQTERDRFAKCTEYLLQAENCLSIDV